jgi:hypothetical protein
MGGIDLALMAFVALTPAERDRFLAVVASVNSANADPQPMLGYAGPVRPGSWQQLASPEALPKASPKASKKASLKLDELHESSVKAWGAPAEVAPLGAVNESAVKRAFPPGLYFMTGTTPQPVTVKGARCKPASDGWSCKFMEKNLTAYRVPDASPSEVDVEKHANELREGLAALVQDGAFGLFQFVFTYRKDYERTLPPAGPLPLRKKHKMQLRDRMLACAFVTFYPGDGISDTPQAAFDNAKRTSEVLQAVFEELPEERRAKLPKSVEIDPPKKMDESTAYALVIIGTAASK